MGSGAYRTPGQLIRALLEERGWTNRVLAIILGIDETGLNKLIAGNRSLSAKLAIQLGEVFGEAPERFLDLQKSYELAQERLRSHPDPGRETRARIYGGLPISEMIARRWLDADDVRNTPAVEASLAKFFGVQSLDEIEILPYAAKRTNVFGEATPAQLAWLYRVKTVANEMLVAPYSTNSLHGALSQLKSLLSSAEEARKVPRIMAEAGIRFVIVESLPGAKIDGVCFWLDENSPVVGMSLRLDRIDNFWFVLRHELEHAARRHGQGAAVMLDTDLEGARAGVGDDIAEEERVANEAAAQFCIPQKSLDAFIARKAPFFHERDIVGFARTLQVHPGLVAGQLQHRTDRHDRFRALQVKIRSIVSHGAMVDGWGNVAPTDP